MNKQEIWVLGPDDTPFYTCTWSPKDVSPTACVVFVHGYAEHIARYDKFFTTLASAPYNLQITAFDQRGHGRTAYHPLTAQSPEVQAWRKEGKHVKLAVNTQRKNGGWARALPDMEWFVKHESEVAKGMGKKLFLWGHSMGGAQTLGFFTRSSAPPSKNSLALIAGVIASSPEIKLTHPAPAWKMAPGTLAVKMGLGDMVVASPPITDELSHDPEVIKVYKADPMCEQRGSLKLLSDLVSKGEELLDFEVVHRWPKETPLLVFAGSDDQVCNHESSEDFVDKCLADDKHFQIFPGMRHELHNELEPTPSEVAKLVGEWIKEHIDTTSTATITAAPAVEQSKL